MKKKLIQHLLLGTFVAMIMTGCGNQTLPDPSLPQPEAFITDDNMDSSPAESHELYETNNETAEYVVPHEAGLDAMAISHEIDVYIENFTALYTNNTLDDTAPTMVIEEQNFPSDNDNGACLTIYSDLSGKMLFGYLIQRDR